MSDYVRWKIQVSKKFDDDPDFRYWIDRPELTYSGWFYSTGNDEPTEALLRDYQEAVETYHWLHVRLVQENSGSSSRVIS